jgi:hypothetical protein
MDNFFSGYHVKISGSEKEFTFDGMDRSVFSELSGNHLKVLTYLKYRSQLHDVFSVSYQKLELELGISHKAVMVIMGDFLKKYQFLKCIKKGKKFCYCFNYISPQSKSNSTAESEVTKRCTTVDEKSLKGVQPSTVQHIFNTQDISQKNVGCRIGDLGLGNNSKFGNGNLDCGFEDSTLKGEGFLIAWKDLRKKAFLERNVFKDNSDSGFEKVDIHFNSFFSELDKVKDGIDLKDSFINNDRDVLDSVSPTPEISFFLQELNQLKKTASKTSTPGHR